MEQVVDTGFADLAPPAAPSPEVAASAPVEAAAPAETAIPVEAASVETIAPVPHPNGPSVAEQLAAQYMAEGDPPAEQTEAEKAFAEPIKLLDPVEHFQSATAVGNDPGAVVESAVARSNREVYERIMAARNAPPAVPVPQPVAKRITDQTSAEMREGARLSAVHAERARTIPRPQPSPREVAAQGTSTPVFRPADYVPDPMRNQGDVRAQPVT